MPARDPGGEGRLARDWLDANLPAEWRLDGERPVTPDYDALVGWEARMHAGGLAGITWPVEYGGRGLTLEHHLAINREIGRTAMPESINSIGKELAGPILLALGSAEQKQALLPAILEMRDVWCQGFSEPEAGSDLAGLKTRAVRDGNGWRITGQKVWTSGAYRASHCLLLARTGSPEQKHRSLSLFALPMDRPGITVRQIRQITGSDEFCEVFLDDVPAADADVIGAVDEGWGGAVGVLEIERATNRMYRGWRFANELDHLVAACRADPALRPLLEDPLFRDRLGGVMVDIAIVKRYAEDTVASLMSDEPIAARGSLMKLHWSEAHQRFAEWAIDVLGNGSAGPPPFVSAARRRFQGIYLQSRAETIYAGTSQIQLGIIADRIVRLPRER